MPPNELTPAALAAYALELAEPASRACRRRSCRRLDPIAGMGAFAAVAQGSARGQRLIELRYDGGGGGAGRRSALIGKGVTFDSGGLTIKPPASIYEEKFDMGGGAAVIEAIAALAELRAPVSRARRRRRDRERDRRRRDAAGRHRPRARRHDDRDQQPRRRGPARARRLHHVREAPRVLRRLVDIATLTGAMVSALGSVYAGLFSNDERLVGDVARPLRVRPASSSGGCRCTRLPRGRPRAATRS